MNTNIILKKEIKLPPFCDKEILRYAGIDYAGIDYAGICNSGNDIFSLLIKCKENVEKEIKSTVVYKILPVRIFDDICDLCAIRVKSKQLSKALRGAEYAVLFAATAGVGIDRLIYKYSHENIAKAHMCDAVATERIEAVCDAFSEELDRELSPEGLVTGARFSPGYGDLPLEFQKEIFSLLAPEKHIGLTLNESLMMSPSKSVSAIAAVKKIREM